MIVEAGAERIRVIRIIFGRIEGPISAAEAGGAMSVIEAGQTC